MVTYHVHIKVYSCNIGISPASDLSSSNNAKNLLTDCLPYLFHGFRNKYFNKISLDNMLYFQNKLYKFQENTWFFDKYAMKNNLQDKNVNYLFPHDQ